ncbi:hypothetical protein EW093_09190 [Thiospirochaeta perfilievii]|uniref:Uncharacterized protein n=1 Tax=Thiospirochaeta perfilievii TaxID=252967 RepID=A0A5C1QBG9_9SPIO|nr:hypothetical protein [Thiospirochaeta perfilievii]QEN04871.1 hypothetical protein EW093_09190 [Thiospirochaeta perfilievii]
MNRRLILNEPESEIINLEVLDELSQDNYPQIDLTPGQWKSLITLILPRIQDRIIDRGLLTSSTESNKIFLDKIFSSLGWENIEFK